MVEVPQTSPMLLVRTAPGVRVGSGRMPESAQAGEASIGTQAPRLPQDARFCLGGHPTPEGRPRRSGAVLATPFTIDLPTAPRAPQSQLSLRARGAPSRQILTRVGS